VNRTKFVGGTLAPLRVLLIPVSTRFPESSSREGPRFSEGLGVPRITGVPDSDSSTHWTIILGAAEGRPLDSAEFARRYEAIIRSYLGARWRAGAMRGLIDDAVQDVFVECLKQDGALTKVDRERPGGFRAFLYGVTRNVARRQEEKRRDVQPIGEVDPASDEEPASRAFDRAWAQALLRQAAELQAQRARAKGDDAARRVELLRLRFSEGRPMREIAEAWQIDARKLEYQYAKARDEFEAALLEVVRLHNPSGAARDEAAHLLELFS